jgi:hypothetical protein
LSLPSSWSALEVFVFGLNPYELILKTRRGSNGGYWRLISSATLRSSSGIGSRWYLLGDRHWSKRACSSSKSLGMALVKYLQK